MQLTILRWVYLAAALISVVLGAAFLQRHLEYVNMHAMPTGLQPFDVNAPIPTCGRWRETMPKTRDPEAYRLYINARSFWRSKVEWQFTRQELTDILHDVQTAANHGDWGARALLAYFYQGGLGPLDTNNVLDKNADRMVEIQRLAVAAGQAWGYYDLGVAHEHGYGGAALDEKIAWAYFLKAAKLGSPEAQMALASAYLKVNRRDAAEAMVMCAYRQGHGPAANDLGITAKLNKNFAASLTYFQAGVRFGNGDSAVRLRLLFDPREWGFRDKQEQNALRELNILPDPQREDRYSQISSALDLNPDLKLTRLDQVLPLPPAELPPWNGIMDAVEPETDAPPSY